jgi:restriction endonuclease S subunit
MTSVLVQADVCLTPKGWRVLQIGALADEFRGGAPLAPSDFTVAGVKVLPKGGVGRTGWLSVADSDLQYCSPDYAAAHLRNQVDESFTVVVLRDLVPSGPSIGLMVQIRDHETYVLAQGVYGFKVNKEVAVPGYLVQVSNTSMYRRLANSLMVGSTQVHITNTAFKRAHIPLPPVAEQEAISEVLGDTDAFVESLEQLIAKKRHIKQGAMQELLRPKDGWITRTLSQIADIRSGGTPSTHQAEYWDGDVLWCTPTDITALKGQKYLATTSRTITSQGLKASSAEMIPAHSIVMTSRATIGECAINRVPLATNQGFKNFVPFRGTDAEFLYYLLLTKKQDFIGLCSGSTFLEIGKTQLVGFEVALPAHEGEQNAIATILSDMDTEIAALEAKLTKTRQVKQGMMRELLTGRIRLVDTSAVKGEQAPEVRAVPAKLDKPHSWAFNEAVVIAVLADRFGKPEFPLGRLRYTKLSYLMHRRAENKAQGYLKKAAGPYNPQTRYAGPERIAEQNGYVRTHQNGKYKGFVAAENIDQARSYFARRYGTALDDWLEQFRYQTNDELERLATVDMAMNELLKQGKPVDTTAVRALIESEPEWAPKLTRTIFSDEGIAAAIAQCRVLFAS